MKYITKILLGLDQFGNTLMGGAPDETISARAGRNKGGKRVIDKIWWTPLAKMLNTVEPGHTDHAIESECIGRQQDEAYKDAYKGCDDAK